MLIVLTNICMVRTILLFFIVSKVPDVRGVAAVYPVTWMMTSVCMVTYYIGFHRKYKVRREENDR